MLQRARVTSRVYRSHQNVDVQINTLCTAYPYWNKEPACYLQEQTPGPGTVPSERGYLLNRRAAVVESEWTSSPACDMNGGCIIKACLTSAYLVAGPVLAFPTSAFGLKALDGGSVSQPQTAVVSPESPSNKKRWGYRVAKCYADWPVVRDRTNVEP